MDRAFYSAFQSGKGDRFLFKPAATVISARRAGTTATYDQLNKYFGITQMPIISSRYWNMVHGSTPEEVKKDEEGMQVMRIYLALEGVDRHKKSIKVIMIQIPIGSQYFYCYWG